MTETVYFDTDCLSAFLWVNNQSLLAQLYPGRTEYAEKEKETRLCELFRVFEKLRMK